MAPLNEQDAWRAAAAAAAVLKGRVCLVETRDESGAIAGFRGSLVTHYEWINVLVLDPKSRAFAALPATTAAHGGEVDYAAYARLTRKALAVWTAVSRCEGFSVRENPAFWLRVLQEVTPSGHGQVSDVPRFFDTPGAVFPRFRLTFQPRDCYDEDLHDESEAIDWVNTFCDAFFSNDDKDSTELDDYLDELAEYSNDTRSQPAVPLQIEFRAPVKRTHGPMGSALQQHREYLDNARRLAARLIAFGTADDLSDWKFSLVGCQAVLRGSVNPREFVSVVRYFDSLDQLRLSGLCMELGDDVQLDDFTHALETCAVTSLTMNVAKATEAAMQRLDALLQRCRHIQTLRLVNAFIGNSRSLWQQFGRALSRSAVETLVVERAHLTEDDAEAFGAVFADAAHSIRLSSLTIKPVTTAGLSMQAYAGLVKTLGADLEYVDLSAFCLNSAIVDEILRACPRLGSLRFGNVDGIESSQLVSLLRHPVCNLSSLSVSCAEQDARSILAALAKQPLDIALAGKHLKELSLSIETLEPATRDALVQMLETNESLRYVHVKRRSSDVSEQADEQLAAHHKRQLVRKLPVTYATAFLSVFSPKTATSAPLWSPLLQQFDAGIASEIVGFAGHAVCRRFYCN